MFAKSAAEIIVDGDMFFKAAAEADDEAAAKKRRRLMAILASLGGIAALGGGAYLGKKMYDASNPPPAQPDTSFTGQISNLGSKLKNAIGGEISRAGAVPLLAATAVAGASNPMVRRGLAKVVRAATFRDPRVVETKRLANNLDAIQRAEAAGKNAPKLTPEQVAVKAHLGGAAMDIKPHELRKMKFTAADLAGKMTPMSVLNVLRDKVDPKTGKPLPKNTTALGPLMELRRGEVKMPSSAKGNLKSLALGAGTFYATDLLNRYMLNQ